MTAETVWQGRDGDLVVEARGVVRLVTLNRPEALNAANDGLHGELATIWQQLDADPEARAIVLTGAGRAFCGGGDLDLLDRMTNDTALRTKIMDEARAIVRGMTAVRCPIVAAVNGPAVGLGCSLASMSDVVVVEEQAYFADPHVALGLVAGDGGALRGPCSPACCGRRSTSSSVTGFRPRKRSGSVSPTASSRRAPAEASLELADRMAALPPQSVRETKALLNHALRGAVGSLLETAVATETASFDEPAFRTNLADMIRRLGSR